MKKIMIILGALTLGACNTTNSEALNVRKSYVAHASWYGGGEKLAKHTANGEVFRRDAMTAAHKHLPFGTRVKVTHKDRSVVVRINDRGPFVKGREIDLSRGAARAIGMSGTAPVKLDILARND